MPPLEIGGPEGAGERQARHRPDPRQRDIDLARREGASEKDCETIRSAFVYEGFRLPLE